ncbi:MAG: hypothetical protein AAFY46_06545 [Planctomycetota bacterium]
MARRAACAALAAVAVGAGATDAQPDMLITVDNVSGDAWEISAEYLTTPPQPIIQLWADASFELTGDGAAIMFTNYNPAYDTSLGNATVVDGPIASFVGNSNTFFGTPDDSNPLFVARFTYAGDAAALTLDLVGGNAAIFSQPPLGNVQLYQDPLGNPGPLTWDVQYIPAPATLAPFALAAARRRRK